MVPTPSLAFDGAVLTPPIRGKKISRQRLVELRQARLWTQQRLSTEADVPLTTIKRWESRGSEYPVVDFESLAKLATAFGLSAAELLAALGPLETAPGTAAICFTPPLTQHSQIVGLADAAGVTPADIVSQLVTDALKRQRVVNGVPVWPKAAASRTKPKPQ